MKIFKIKNNFQKFGNFLSSLIMPNIAAFIAWGFITAFFIDSGWLPNKKFQVLIEPMIKYLIPLLIAYRGGSLIWNLRGGVVASVATIGLIVGSSVPMLFAAMLVGPLSGVLIKKIDLFLSNKIKSGFEMLVNNFVAGILAMFLAIISLIFIAPLLDSFSLKLGFAVDFLVKNKFLFLTAILVEPAKVLFLNNSINHGIFTPLGIQEVKEFGHSLLFLIETNPGPGLGVLLAYFFYSNSTLKESSSSAIIIHFFGGIHEIYFPYSIIKPTLFIALILGGMTGIISFSLLNVGLIAPHSPGSIISLLAMTAPPLMQYLYLLIGVFSSTFVSFLISIFILKKSNKIDSLANETLKDETGEKSDENLKENLNFKDIKLIAFACDAGMGSSLLGANLLRRELLREKIEKIEVINLPIKDLKGEIDLVITQRDLSPYAREKLPHAQHLSLLNFSDKTFYKSIAKSFKSNKNLTKTNFKNAENVNFKDLEIDILNIKSSQIFLNASANNKFEAIKEMGKQLSFNGFVEREYIDFMLERERQGSTYIGNYVSLPHGTFSSLPLIKKSGIVIFQYPKGLDWDNEKVFISIGLAIANPKGHVPIISKILNLIDNIENVENLSKIKHKEDFISFFTKSQGLKI